MRRDKHSLSSLATRRLVMVCVAFLLAMLSGTALADSDSSRPNFIVILCDDLGYGDLACFGHPDIRTPNLDQLATEGIRLTNCYSAAPVCSPSRAGLLTGRTPNRVGIFDWIPPNTDLELAADEITIATLLRNAGYDTFLAGKWHLNGRFADNGKPTPGDHGFNYWFASSNNAQPSHRSPRNMLRNGEAVGEVEGFACQIVADEAMEWLRERRDPDKPFFQFICFHEPHEPVASPPDLVDSYASATDNRNRAAYFANVTNMDAAVGRLLKTIEELDLEESTLIFFTSDNGPETLNRYRGAERSYGSPGPLRGMKLHLHEGGIRVPGILRWTGTITPGQVLDLPICGIDVLPTLCELAGVDPPNDRVIDGTSIAPIIHGEAMQRTRPLFWTYFRALGGAHAVMRDGPWKIVAQWNGQASPASGRITEQVMQMIGAGELTTFELYNLLNDVPEAVDLVGVESERARVMRERLEAIYEEVKLEGIR